jgi:hypothetical protein
VGVVKRAVHVVVDVVAVRHGFVAGLFVGTGAGALDRCAGAWPPPVHVEAVLVGVALVRRVQVPVVQVVGVVAVPHGLVAAAVAVEVRVPGVLVAAHARIVSRPEGAVNRGIIA